MATRRFSLVLLLAVLMMTVACGSGAATNTPPPTKAPATLVPTLVPTIPPAPTAIPPLPTVSTSGTVAPTPTPTKFAVAVPTESPTRAAAATKPPVEATVKPPAAAVTGRIAYSLVTDPAPRLHSVWFANANGTGATKMMDYAGWPAYSPDGKRLAFFLLPGSGKNEGLYVADAYGGNAQPVFISPGACCFHWSRDGVWVVFANSARPKVPGGPILKVKMDGTYKTIVDLNVFGNGPSFSPDGNQVVYSGCTPGTNTCGLLALASDGSGAPRVITRDNGGNAEWSPDGRRILYQADDGSAHTNVFVINADGSGKKQLTNGKSNDGQPIWSRDGGSIFWRSDQNGTSWAIYVMNADGSNQRKIVSNVPPDPDLWGWEALTVAP